MDKLVSLVTPMSTALALMLRGPSCNIALAALGKAVANDDQATADQIVAALSGGGADLTLKVQSAEAEARRVGGQTQVALAGIAASTDAKRLDTYAQLESISSGDRADARAMQAKTNDKATRWLAYGVSIGFFIVLVLVIFAPAFPFGNVLTGNAVAETLLGVMGTGWISIIAFYFGSSVGSKEKTALLGDVVTHPNLTPPT